MSQHPGPTWSQAPGVSGRSYQPTTASHGRPAAAAPSGNPQYGSSRQSSSGSQPIPQGPHTPRESRQRSQSTRAPSAQPSQGAHTTGQGGGAPYTQASQQAPQHNFQQGPGSARPWQQATPRAPPPQSTSYGSQYQAPNNPFSARTWTPQAQAASQTAPPPLTSSTRNGHPAPTPSETRYPPPDSPFVTPGRPHAPASSQTAQSIRSRSSAAESVYPMGKPNNVSDSVSWLKIAHGAFESYSTKYRLSNATSRYGEALQFEGRMRDRYSNRHRFSKSARQGLDIADVQDEFYQESLMKLADEDLDNGQFAYMMNRCMSKTGFSSDGVRLPSEGACAAIGTLAAYSTAPDSAMIKGAMQVIEGPPAPDDEIDLVILSQWPRIRRTLDDNGVRLPTIRHADGSTRRYQHWERIYDEDKEAILRNFPKMAETLDKHKDQFAGLNFDFLEAASLPEKVDYFAISHPIRPAPGSGPGASRSNSRASSSRTASSNHTRDSSRSQARRSEPPRSKSNRYQPNR